MKMVFVAGAPYVVVILFTRPISGRLLQLLLGRLPSLYFGSHVYGIAT
jgi:hypothetical protein